MDAPTPAILKKPSVYAPKNGVDKERIERAVREILYAIGDDPQREGLLDTPKRVAKAYEEMFSGLASDPFEVLGTVFHENYRDIVMVRNIEVSSFCEHHLLPFRGTASIGYLPAKEGGVVGLSKLARLVEVFARRPQVQERLTTQIADALEAALDAEGVIVEIECEHSCMSFRGVKKSGSTTVTSTLRGVFRDDPQQQAMVLNLLRGGNKS